MPNRTHRHLHPPTCQGTSGEKAGAGWVHAGRAMVLATLAFSLTVCAHGSQTGGPALYGFYEFTAEGLITGQGFFSIQEHEGECVGTISLPDARFGLELKECRWQGVG